MDNKEYIGKKLRIKIDRPLGSIHPKHGFIYPVNYGFVPNTISGDGGASVRRIIYSWWKSNLVIFSEEPVVNLGAEIVRLGLSVGK